MSSSRLLQRLDSHSNPANGGPSAAVGSSPYSSSRCEIEEFLVSSTSSAIAIGEVVAFESAASDEDRALYVRKQDAAAPDLNLSFGIALDACASPSVGRNKIRVCVGGLCPVPVYVALDDNQDLAIGDVLVAADQASTTFEGHAAEAAGSLKKIDSHTELPVAVAMTASTQGSDADVYSERVSSISVWVLKHF